MLHIWYDFFFREEIASAAGTGRTWFSPIDAFQWQCLLGIHPSLHRRQIAAIRDGLSAA